MVSTDFWSDESLPVNTGSISNSVPETLKLSTKLSSIFQHVWQTESKTSTGVGPNGNATPSTGGSGALPFAAS